MPSLPVTQNITIHQNTVFQASILLEVTEGTPVDLTGATVKGEIGESGETPIIDLEPSISISTPEDGIITIFKLIPEERPGNYLYDIIVIWPDTGNGVVPEKVVQGEALLIETITE